MDITMTFEEALDQLEHGVYGADVRAAIYNACYLAKSGTDTIGEGGIKTFMLDDGVVTNAKIANNTINGLQKIAENSITSSRLADDCIYTRHIQDGQVTKDHLEEGLKNTVNGAIDQAYKLYNPSNNSDIKIVEKTTSLGVPYIDYEIQDSVIGLDNLSTDLKNALSQLEETFEKIGDVDIAYITMAIDALDANVEASDIQASYNFVNDYPVGVNFQIKASAVNTAEIANGAVKTAKIYDGAVTSAKIGQYAVEENNINGEAVTKAKLAPIIQTALEEWQYWYNYQQGMLDKMYVVQGMVRNDTESDIEFQITDSTNPDDPVPRVLLKNKTGSMVIQPGAINHTHIGTGEVYEENINNGAVTENKLHTDAVTTDKIADYNVTMEKLSLDLSDLVSDVVNNRDDWNETVYVLNALIEGTEESDVEYNVEETTVDPIIPGDESRTVYNVTNTLKDGVVKTAKIADEAVENGKIAPLSITEDKLATALQEKLFLGTSWVAVSRNKINPSAIVIENPDEEIPIEQQQEAAADALASAYPWRTSGGSAKFATRMDSDDGRGSLPLNPTTYAVWQTGKRIHGELQFTSEYDFTEGYKQGTIKCNEWVEEQKALAEEIERIKAQEYGYDVHTGCTVTVLNDGTDEHYADFSVDIPAFTVHEYYLENGKSLALKAPTAGILAKNGEETSTSIANEYSANGLTWAIAYSFPDEAQADNYIIPLTRAQYEAAVAENDNIIDKDAKIAELEALVDPAYSNALSRLLKKTQILSAIMTEMYGATAMDNLTETIICQDGFNRKIVLLPKWRPSHLPLKDTCYTTIGGNITKFDGTHVPITGYINSNGTVAFYVDRVETKTEVDSTVFFNKLNLWFDYELA